VNGQDLTDKIETAFSHRCMPTEVIEPEQHMRVDSDVEEALWFADRDWHDITSQDWQQRDCAVTFLSRDAFAYYLPSLLIVTVQDPQNYPDLAVGSLISSLDRSPDVAGWDDLFTRRFLGLRSEEYDAIKEWLLFVCENVSYFRYGDAASGAGETFGRAFDTIDLLQRESELQRAMEVGNPEASSM
jgi:hypothetical protein